MTPFYTHFQQRELLPMLVLQQELASTLTLPSVANSLVKSTVFEDNQGCLALVNVPKMSPRNKYLALKYSTTSSDLTLERKREL